MAVDGLPTRLWHYTDQRGFLGMIESGTLWASKVQYQNDQKEYRLTAELAASIIKRRLDGRRSDNPVSDFLESLSEHIEGRLEVNVCTASLTAKGDLLSQWRGYCRPGDGLSLGFDAEEIEGIAGSLGWSLERCLYNRDEQLEVVERLIDEGVRWLTSAPRHREPPGAAPGPIQAGARDFALRIMAHAPTMKHQSFAEESEWRLISPPQDFRTLCYRPGRHTIVPYKAFPLRQEPLDALATVEVKIGPTAHPLLAQSAAGGVLMAAEPKIPAYNVTVTETSYRDW